MNVAKTTAGVALAVAAAGLLAGCYSNASKTEVASAESTVHCYGVNKCKGHNDCKTANNACKGMASCKGHGFVNLSAHACSEVGGTVGN